jgi:hypothetical protein
VTTGERSGAIACGTDGAGAAEGIDAEGVGTGAGIAVGAGAGGTGAGIAPGAGEESGRLNSGCCTSAPEMVPLGAATWQVLGEAIAASVGAGSGETGGVASFQPGICP